MVQIKSVGVIGAGQMGTGIAHVVALGGYDVLQHDVSQDRIDAGIELIHHNMTRQVARGVITQDAMDAGLSHIKGASELQTIGATDLAIEAATENEETKKTIFKALGPHLGDKTLLASNTSSISITRLAAATDRPDRFIGLHFMNPAPLMKLVEIIRGIATGPETYETAVQFAQSLGKTTANAEDFPAFIVNRVLVPMINEAIYTLYEGVGTVEAIDTAMKLGANHPMGPLELGGLHRAGYGALDHERALRGPGGLQVPALPAADQICRGRLAGPQGRPRLLRLPRRAPRPDPLGRLGVELGAGCADVGVAAFGPVHQARQRVQHRASPGARARIPRWAAWSGTPGASPGRCAPARAGSGSASAWRCPARFGEAR